MKNLNLFLLWIALCFFWKPTYAQSGTSSTTAILIPTNQCIFIYYSDYKNNSVGFSNNNTANASPDVWYKFTLTNTATVKVSTCGSDFDTYLSIKNQSNAVVATNDDNGPSCTGTRASITQSLAAGTYYIVTEGSGNFTGNIALSVNIDGSYGTVVAAGANMTNAIDAGTFSASGSYSNTKSNADPCLGNNYGQPSNDIYYKFTLAGPADVTLSHCGSGFDTYMSLLDGLGNLIASNDDNSGPVCPGVQAYMKLSLTAGVYYVVSEGSNTNTGNIVTNISVLSTVQAPVISYVTPSIFSVGSYGTISPANTGGIAVPTARTIAAFAGSGTAGFANGTGAAASFYYPSGLALSKSGDVYVVDRINNRIRKITPAGVVTTFAGSGAAGSADGTGTAATFNTPHGIAIDTAGNLYVADWGNHMIRKITPAGVVSTFAGYPAPGYLNEVGDYARFNGPDALTVDESGTVYVADGNNHRIRKISPSRVVTTFVGNGTSGYLDGIGESAKFNHPDCVVLDGAGYLYVGETANKRIRKVTASGEVTTFVGSGVDGTADGTGVSASFRSIISIGKDGSNNLYITDMSAHNIRKITPDRVVTTYAGSGASGSTGISIRNH